MTDLIVVNDAEGRSAFFVARRLQFFDHAWGHIEPARFEHQRGQRQAGGQIVLGVLCGHPQTIVCGEIAVDSSQICKSFHYEKKMTGLICTHAYPIANEGGPGVVGYGRVAAKSGEKVERQINGVELNMGHRM